MENKKLSFEDFILTVDVENQDFVKHLHEELVGLGCKIEVKSAKSGYVVSYTRNRKTIANYVFRKKGIIIRIYAGNVISYMEFLDGLPDEMAKAISDAPLCKRMINPDACNPKCSMGYDFIMNSEHHQKCRYNAFMFLLSDENNPFIEEFLIKEIKFSTSA